MTHYLNTCDADAYDDAQRCYDPGYAASLEKRPMSPSLQAVLKAFYSGWHHPARRHCNKKDKALRENLSEDKLDDMIESSFPASDPPSTY